MCPADAPSIDLLTIALSVLGVLLVLMVVGLCCLNYFHRKRKRRPLVPMYKENRFQEVLSKPRPPHPLCLKARQTCTLHVAFPNSGSSTHRASFGSEFSDALSHCLYLHLHTDLCMLHATAPATRLLAHTGSCGLQVYNVSFSSTLRPSVSNYILCVSRVMLLPACASCWDFPAPPCSNTLAAMQAASVTPVAISPHAGGLELGPPRWGQTLRSPFTWPWVLYRPAANTRTTSAAPTRAWGLLQPTPTQ